VKHPRVVIVGHVCIDHNVTEHATYHSWGSPAMYIDDYYQKSLAIKPKIITSYGPDFLPYSAHVELIPSKPQQQSTLLYRNIITTDLRTWYCEHTAYAVPPKLTPEAVAALQQADICILGLLLPNYPANYAKELLRHTRPDCIKGMVTQGYLRNVGMDSKVTPRDFAEAAEVLPLFNVAVLSDEDHPQAAAMAKRWKRLPGVQDIVLTHGPRGAGIVGPKSEEIIPTSPLRDEDIVDSVGCGDVFFGSLMYEYFLSGDLASAIANAHVAARKKLLAIPSSAQTD
jgi:sugar/nucleoside kinase (ribokinase family)